jgi:hypothetical protein
MTWEYAVIPELIEGLSSASIAKVLNDMGENGWELAGVVGRMLILKRPVDHIYVGKPCDCLAPVDWS